MFMVAHASKPYSRPGSHYVALEQEGEEAWGEGGSSVSRRADKPGNLVQTVETLKGAKKEYEASALEEELQEEEEASVESKLGHSDKAAQD